MLAVALFALASHPFLTYPLSLQWLTRRGRAQDMAQPVGAPRPTIAICTCAYNEARVIEAKIQNMLELREHYGELELLLYVDAASDGTADIARRYADRITLVVSTERHGKTHGMNLLVERTSAEIVVFTDANVRLAPDALERLAPHFADPGVGCVCGDLTYTNADASVTASTGSAYWRFEQWLKRRESQLGAVMGADGSIFAIRRALHHVPPDYLIDDMFVSFQILCDGYRVIQVDDVHAYEESVTASGEEFRRKVRIACQAFNVHRMIWPRLAREASALTLYLYVSHKLLRWFSIYLLAGSYLFLVAALCLAQQFELAVAFVVVCGLLLAVGWKWAVPPLSQIVDVLVALLGAGYGVWRSWRGERYQTWQPAASIRK